jgi:hypothetical protein
MSLALTAMSLPSWANAWNSETFKGSNSLIFSIVNAIIPETDSPGARTIGVHNFIERMLNDCFDSQMKKTFLHSLTSFDEQCERLFKQKFEQLSLEKQIDFLKNVEASGNTEDRMVLQLMKKLTIQAYVNSEYFLTKHRNYTIAPGFYHGCTPIQI